MKLSRVIIPALIIIALVWIVIELNKKSDGYIYGNSYRQNQIVNTIRLHKYGITGKKIKIGILGAGFYTPHTVFAETRILKEFDFATGKNTTLNYNHKKGMDHGTNVLSVIGGYKINEVIGIAYGADFILAKTDKSTDRLVEEELYAVYGARWLFESGANIISTSLSFNKFDNADYYYPYQMNGTTAVITKTADSLSNLGVIFCCSAGNKYEESWHIIEPPGDGFNVLSVGSIDKNLRHSFFSSAGPTVDGRIKPDIVTPGEGVWNANYLPKIKLEYGWNHGTSLSAPIAAGIAALVLSTHPELTNFQVIEAIKQTSSKINSPDTLYGWGIPDAEKAVSYFGPAFSNLPELDFDGAELEIGTYLFSSSGLNKSSVEIHVLSNNQNGESIQKMEEADENYFQCNINFSIDKRLLKFYFTAEDENNKVTKFPSGILGNYFIVEIIHDEPKIRYEY